MSVSLHRIGVLIRAVDEPMALWRARVDGRVAPGVAIEKYQSRKADPSPPIISAKTALPMPCFLGFLLRKFLPGIQARLTARLVLATNNLPCFADRSGGMWRRVIVVPFNVTIPPNRQDPHLAEKLKEELPGILNWSLEGLRRLRKQGCFTTPTVSKKALNEYRIECNPAKAFLAEFCIKDSGGEIEGATLYSRYRFWCGKNGHNSLDSGGFGKEVRRDFPQVSHVQRRRNGQRLRVYAGIRVSVTASQAI